MMQLDGYQGADEFIWFSQSLHNLTRSINERLYHVKIDGVYQKPPLPDEDHFGESLFPVLVLLRKYVISVTCLRLEEVPATFKGKKVKIYENSVQSLFDLPLNEKDFVMKCFGKFEKVNCSRKSYNDIVNRLICPFSYRYNAQLSRFVKPLSKPMIHCIDSIFMDVLGLKVFEPTVMKGLDAVQIGQAFEKKFSHFYDPVAFGIDATRWDQHFSVVAQKWVFSFFEEFFAGQKAGKFFRYLLNRQISRKGTAQCAEGYVNFKLDGGLPSGVANTTDGNCVLMPTLVFAYCLSHDINKFAMADMGDDGTIIMERSDAAKFDEKLVKEWFVSMGFNLKVEPMVDRLEQIEFCQAHPVRIGGVYIMVRNPHIAVSRDAISAHPFLSVKGFTAYTDSIGQGGMALTGGVPVMQNYYRSMLRSSEASCPTGYDVSTYRAWSDDVDYGMFGYSKTLNRHFNEPSQDDRYSFYVAFGILPNLQKELELYYDNLIVSYKGRDPAINNPLERYRFHCFPYCQ